MIYKAAIIAILLASPAVAMGQERLLSVPDRPPVPLSDSDQSKTGGGELAKNGIKRPEAPASPLSVSAPPAAATPRMSVQHFTTGNSSLDGIVGEAASQFGIDPCLIVSIMRQESGFNSRAVSYKGASGIMQLMPATAIRFGVRNIFDVRENVLGGTKYLRWLLDRYQGDVRLALAAYNAGEGAVETYSYQIPPYAETIDYVRIIYSRYSAAHSAAHREPAQATRTGETKPPAEQPNISGPSHNQIVRFSDNGNKNN